MYLTTQGDKGRVGGDFVINSVLGTMSRGDVSGGRDGGGAGLNSPGTGSWSEMCLVFNLQT